MSSKAMCELQCIAHFGSLGSNQMGLGSRHVVVNVIVQHSKYFVKIKCSFS